MCPLARTTHSARARSFVRSTAALTKTQTMEATFRSFVNFVSTRRGVVGASVISALVVVHHGSWFQFLLWLLPHVFVAVLGVLHAAGLALCQGKYYKPRTTTPSSSSSTHSALGRLILQRAETDPRLRRLRQRRDGGATVGSRSTAPAALSRLVQDAFGPRATTTSTSLPSTSSAPPTRVVISRNMDVVYSEIFDLISRDFLFSWLAPLSRDPSHLIDVARRLYWHVLAGVGDRLDAVDWVRFISADLTNLLERHFVDIRLATLGDDQTGKKTPFKPHPHLDSSEREMKFLRRVADSLLWILLPEDERNDETLRGLLREVVAYDVLYPTIHSICDPDYINQSLLHWIEYRESVATAQKRTYAYAKNYEEFIKMIDESDDVEQLKQIRYQVMTEIMQATTINKLKQTDSRSPSSAPDSVTVDNDPQTTRQTKGEMLKARNLKRYINQCTIAKSVAEKRLRVIGGRDYAKYGVDDGAAEEASIPGKKVLSFNVVMASNCARSAFLKYLQREEVAPLLLFWEGVAFRMKKPVRDDEEGRIGDDEEAVVDKDYVSEIHHVGTELYQRHISAIQSVVKLNKTTIRGMHAFLLGDQGPEPFQTVKSVIARALEEKYYPSFLVSDIYYNFVSQIPSVQFGDDADNDASRATSAFPSTMPDNVAENYGDIGASTFSLVEADSRPALAEHSTYAQKKLSTLSAKILNKSSALDALKAAQKPSNAAVGSSSSSSSSSLASAAAASVLASNSKQHRLIAQLEREVEVLQAERCQLSAFIERTDSWLSFVGRWRVTVSQNSNIEEGGKMIPYFVLLVHLESSRGDESERIASSTPESVYSKYSDTHGFVVTRRLTDFHLLHKKLQLLAPHLGEDRSFKLPSPGIFDKDTSDRFLEKAMAKLQAYMTTVMADDVLSQSEALYAFCCPTPEFLASPGTGGGGGVKGKSGVFYYAGLEGFGGIPGGGGVASSNSCGKDDPTEKTTPFSGIKRAFSSTKKTNDDDYVDDPHDFLVQDDGGNGDGGNNKKVADSFAEPMYKLVAEIFELRGVFRFFRQSLITFVRVTFGKSINKQLRDFIQWLFGDTMSVYYLTLFKDSTWLPDGRLAPALPPRTDDEKRDTRRRCKLKLVQNIPDVLNHLFGHQTSQRGVIKIFESFQDARLNEHLFYSLFECVVFEVFPELKNVD